MQPCFTPVWHRKAGVSIFSIFTDDLSLEYIECKISRKRPVTPASLNFWNSFPLGILSNALLKSTKQVNKRLFDFLGLDLTYLSISAFKMKILLKWRCYWCYCSVLVSAPRVKNEWSYMCSVLVSTHVFKNELCHMCGVLVLTHGTTRLPENELCYMLVREHM